MKIIYKKNCIIGEGPIWCDRLKRLYFVNPINDKEICTASADGKNSDTIKMDFGVAAVAFTDDERLLLSTLLGVFIYDEKSGRTELFADIKGCNDAKVGPDGRLYVGTQSSKRLGKSNEIDGKLYRVDKDGSATVLLDGLILSNGLDWSADENFFYHTDSDTGYIKEYAFDKKLGEISYTKRQVLVPGVDGFCISEDGFIFAACWGRGHIAKIDTRTMETVGHIKVPVPIPTSCAFFGENMEHLAVTTSNYNDEARTNPKSGYTFSIDVGCRGKKPYIFSSH